MIIFFNESNRFSITFDSSLAGIITHILGFLTGFIKTCLFLNQKKWDKRNNT